MRRRAAVLLLSLSGFAGLTAQAPAPATTAPKPPLRHLEYSVNIVGENAAAPQGGNGTMDVDVMSVATDGALAVRVSELMQGDTAPRQDFTCNVYGNTSVFCPKGSSPTPEEWVLLSYLGRQFVDGAPWDAQGHWQRAEQSAGFDAEEAFTLVDASNGKKVVIREIKKLQLHNSGLDDQISDVTINYDRSMEIPDVIWDEVTTVGAKTDASSVKYVFTLQHDSFVKPK